MDNKMQKNASFAFALLISSTAAHAVFAQENSPIPPSLTVEGQAANPTPPLPAVSAPVADPVDQRQNEEVAPQVLEAAQPSVMPQTVPVSLSFKEQTGVDLANQWKDRPELPREGPDGAITYLYGAAMPTLVCSPLQICTISLEPGEVVAEDGVHAGDSARWLITPSTVGKDANLTTYVVVKPREANLETNLFITTDRRAYMIKLLSSNSEWMPIVSFDYPKSEADAWGVYRERVAEAQKPATPARTRATSSGTSRTRSSAPSTNVANAANLNFNYRITGRNVAWKPVRVYTDGVKTYIQFPGVNFPSGAPALVALDSSGQQRMVNYRLTGDRYVVDQVIQRAMLVEGTGRNQTRVELRLTR